MKVTDLDLEPLNSSSLISFCYLYFYFLFYPLFFIYCYLYFLNGSTIIVVRIFLNSLRKRTAKVYITQQKNTRIMYEM